MNNLESCGNINVDRVCIEYMRLLNRHERSAGMLLFKENETDTFNAYFVSANVHPDTFYGWAFSAVAGSTITEEDFKRNYREINGKYPVPLSGLNEEEIIRIIKTLGLKTSARAAFIHFMSGQRYYYNRKDETGTENGIYYQGLSKETVRDVEEVLVRELPILEGGIVTGNYAIPHAEHYKRVLELEAEKAANDKAKRKLPNTYN